MRLISCRFLLTSVSIAGLFTANLQASNKSAVASRDSIKKDFNTLESVLHYELNDNQGVAVNGFNEIRSLGVSGSGLASFQMTFNAKELTVTYQLSSAESERQFKSSLEGVTELKFIRRSGVLYLYLTTEEGSYPFIGLDCGLSDSLGLEIQSSTASREQSNLSQRFDCPPTHALKHHINERASGVKFTGEWTYQDSKSDVGFWESASASTDVSASLAINGLLQGEHEVWVKNPSSDHAATSATLQVSNGLQMEQIEIDYSQAQGLWVGVGRYNIDKNQGQLDLSILDPVSGSLVLQHILCVWSHWEDLDKDNVPDILASRDLREGRAEEIWKSMLSRQGVTALQSEKQRDALTNNPIMQAVNGYPVKAETGEILYFADSEIGDDENDGTSASVDLGAWIGQRVGPKKTLDGLKVFHNEERPVLLKLNGTFEELAPEFRTFKGLFGVEGGPLGAHFGINE